jgi:hypothetical protein
MLGDSKGGSGQCGQFAHARRFRLGCFAALPGDAVVAPALVVQVWIGAVTRFFD